MRINCPVGVKIKHIVQETHDVKTFILDHKMKVKAGQFVMIWIPEVDEKPFAVVEAGEQLAVTVKKRGKATETMHRMRVGDILGIRGPYGNGFKLTGEEALLIGGGYGTADLLMLAQEAYTSGVKVTSIIGADSELNLLFMEKFKRFGEVIVTTDDGSKGMKGFATHALEKMLKEKRFDCIYTCGPEVMMYEVVKMAGRYDLKVQASLERWMKCGFGLCGQCCLDPTGLLVCKDGPVFETEVLKNTSDFGSHARDKTGRKIKLEELL